MCLFVSYEPPSRLNCVVKKNWRKKRACAVYLCIIRAWVTVTASATNSRPSAASGAGRVLPISASSQRFARARAESRAATASASISASASVLGKFVGEFCEFVREFVSEFVNISVPSPTASSLIHAKDINSTRLFAAFRP